MKDRSLPRRTLPASTQKRGFALVEMMLVIAVLGVISGLTVPQYLRYQVRSDLSNTTSLIEQGMARARLLSQTGHQDSAWGFSAEHGVLFKGESYQTRDPAFDESYPIPSSINTSGTTEVWFDKITGTPNAPGSIITLAGNYGEEQSINLQLDGIGSPINMSDFMLICHHGAGGSMTTMYVSDAQAVIYLGQGDTTGECPASSSSSVSSLALASSSSSHAGSASSAIASSSAASSVASSIASSSSSSVGGGGGSTSSTPAQTTKGVFLIDSGMTSGLAISGNARLTVASPGIVVVNTPNSAAITVSNNGVVTSPHFYTVGSPGKQTAGNGAVNGTMHPGVAPTADPLAALPVPQPAATQLSRVTASGNASTLLSPNTYQGIVASGNARVTLSPGTYYINGNLSITGNSMLSGSGVMIYVTNGSVTISGNGGVSLKPPSSGTYAGVTIFQNRTSSSVFALSGNGNMNIKGALYGLAAPFTMGGNGAGNIAGSLVVAKSLILSSNAVFSVQ